MSRSICATCANADTRFCSSDGTISCTKYEPKPESNYDRLFGTPERAARTLHGGTLICRECLIREQCAETPEDSNCMVMSYDALLDWLKEGSSNES